MRFKQRKAGRKLSVKNRFLSLTGNERIISNKLLKCAQILTLKINNINLSLIDRNAAINVLKQLLLIYIYINIDPDIRVLARPSLNRTIESFSESDCWNFFETKKTDLHRLLAVLKFPITCILGIILYLYIQYYLYVNYCCTM
jgi:hypothetical protein